MYTLGVDPWIKQLESHVREWSKQAARYFEEAWGLAPSFAIRVAVLYAGLHFAGLRPQITSGFRDPEKQAAMRAAWDAGNRAGLRARPALSSAHTMVKKGFLKSSPASEAIDIKSTDETRAAAIARALGLGTGMDFRDPDPGHYFWKAV